MEEQEVQRLREGHGEGGAAWLRAELEAKSAADLRKLCAKLGLAQRRDGANLRKDQLLDSIVDSFSSQEGWSQGMGVMYSSTLLQSVFAQIGVCFWYPCKFPSGIHAKCQQAAALQPNLEDGLAM